MAALDDLPCWAAEEGARLWCRGECGVQHNYTWPPAPAALPGIARLPECAVRFRATQLQMLLAAEEERVFSAEHCARMRARLGRVLKTAGVTAPRLMSALPLSDTVAAH
jgi:hypothetical protein